jgi:rhodanese-related sulfurtransferase
VFKFFKKRKQNISSIKDPVRILYDLRKCEIFRDVPELHVQEMVAHMKEIDGRPGDVIVKEGEPGDYYYVLLRGRANVFRRVREGGRKELVAQLVDGAGFGEEALILGATRNATVKLKKNSLVLRLPKEPFIDYIEKSLVEWLNAADALARVKGGARWLDVREKHVSEAYPLEDALVIPLLQLRDRSHELFKEDTYICCCEDGRLSATAAFLLRQQRFKVLALKGGLQALRKERAAVRAREAAEKDAPPEGEKEEA